jgi:esterase
MKLFCRQFGTGKPVVILHGLFGLSDNWVTFGRQLSEHYMVLIPDLRNHGQSLHSNVFDFPSLENDLFEMVEEYGLIDLCLIGHSLGGKTAMYFTLHHPGLVMKLVVEDISLRKSMPNSEHQQLLNAIAKTGKKFKTPATPAEKCLLARSPQP